MLMSRLCQPQTHRREKETIVKSPLRAVGITAIAAAIVLVAPAMTASAASLDDGPGVSPQSLCSPGWYYSNTSRGADTFSKVGSTHSDYNGTPTPATVTFTATTSGTLTATASGSLNVGLSVKVASIAST